MSIPYELAHSFGQVRVHYAHIAPQSFLQHAHPELEIGFPQAGAYGSAVWQSATGKSLIQKTRAETVSILPSYQPHGGQWERPADHLLVYLTPEVPLELKETLQGRTSAEIIGTSAEDDVFLKSLGDALRAECVYGLTRLTPIRERH